MHTQRRYATCFGMSKKKRIKDAYIKKVRHMLSHVKKMKEKIAPYPKRKKKKREMVHTKEFIHHPPKISTHLHILIKVYDLFLLWIRSLTQQNMKSKFSIISSIPTDPPKKRSHQKQDGKRKAHKKALVRNETHLSDSRDHPRNLQKFLIKNFIKPPD